MHMLYDSDSFVVVHMQVDAEDTGATGAQDYSADITIVKEPVLERNRFDIVYKCSEK